MFILIAVIFSYILSFQILTFFRKETSNKVIEKIQLKLEEDEKIINTGYYTDAIIILLCLLFAFSSLCIFQDKSLEINKCGYYLFFMNLILSFISVLRNFKKIIVLTNKSVLFSYGVEPQIEKIGVENIADSKYIWCFRPFLDIKLKNGECKVISHMTNCDEISSKITELVSKKY